MHTYKASITYTANGTQKVFSIPFDYLRPLFIKVYFNETLMSYATDYLVANREVRFTVAPPSGVVVEVRRVTDTVPLVSWHDASVLRASDMTLSQIQNLHVLEEMEDWIYRSGMTYSEALEAWNGQSRRITNVLDPKEPQDVVTLKYIEDVRTGYISEMSNLLGATKLNANKAKASETAAKASETAAASSKTAAKASETAAKASETAAKASETAAKASETAAASSKTAAKASETAAASSETVVKDSADKAKASETAAKASETSAKDSADKAKASETVAKASKTAAASSETAAKASETAAASSKTAAKASETAAASSKTAAASSETVAKDSADKAKASETAAKASETSAKDSADKAKASETVAKASETSATNQAARAQNIADSLEGLAGITGTATTAEAIAGVVDNKAMTPLKTKEAIEQGAHTFRATNIFRANIAVSNGTTAGSQGQIVLGIKPSTASMVANIMASTTGALNYIATENTGHYFRIGNATARTSITTNEGETAIFSHNAFEFARVTNVGVARWLGNANTATKLEISRTINGVAFDGTKDIIVESNPVGTIIAVAYTGVPKGYMHCNGAAVSRTTYANLFNVIGTTYGAGNGSTTFNLPNTVARFLEGGIGAGTYYEAGLPNITGTLSAFNGDLSGAFAGGHQTSRYDSWEDDQDAHGTFTSFNASRSSSIYGASTTVQPPAMTVIYCIKY